ncbi:hypothetical protein QVD17_36172 [Tagetes erecta]|uniref:Uncharacterized protein n=1 Tax=Tagetes erecta TaxID=13708 RepID=A0AAD8JTL0_TARER|nr:hypothetical protein QVD17_36172 [Tagetes erecta]
MIHIFFEMDDEFEEADVIFVQVEVLSKHDNSFVFETRQLNKLYRRRRKKKRKIASLPINIPENKSNLYGKLEFESDLFEDDGNDERIIPPHVIQGRKTAENVACSICTRLGQTLKIRDFVLRMTGFLEA